MNIHAAPRRWIAIRQLALEGALVRVLDSFEEAGVRSLLLKGAAFANWLYADPLDRPYGDLDLLICPEHFPAARRCLSRIGLTEQVRGAYVHEVSPHHEVWVHEQSSILVELHHGPGVLGAPPARIWEVFATDRQVVQIAGRTVAVPAPAPSALLVVLHAVQHGPRFPNPIRDLRRAIEVVDLATWRSAAALAERLDVAATFGHGLELVPEGADLRARLGLTDLRAAREVRLMAQAAPGTALWIERLAQTREMRTRLRLFGLLLVPSRESMLTNSPLARRGRSGLLLAYLVRPPRLLLRFPAGLRAWLAAG